MNDAQAEKEENRESKKEKEKSICYYLQNSIRNKKVSQAMCSHIDIDTEQELLKHIPEKPVNFISFCDTQGMCYSMKSL